MPVTGTDLGKTARLRSCSVSARIAALLLVLAFSSGCRLLGGGGEAPAELPVFYPALPQQPRIQYLESFSSAREVDTAPSWFQRFVLGEPEYGELGKPYGVALHGGKLFVCDTRLRIVVIFDLVGGSTSFLGDRDPGRLQKPVNIAIHDDGTRYVADTVLGRVLIYDESNRYAGAIGHPDKWSPSDVVIAGDRLYVVDVKGGQVVVVERRTGQEIRRFGRRGSGKGEMFVPTNIGLDGDGNIYVSDTGNARVIKFDPDGRVLHQFGSLGRRLGQLVRPKGIAVDREGRLYVVDAAFENVQIFGPEGKLLLFFGKAGNFPGGMNLPAKVAIDYEGVEFFADRVATGYDLEYLILVTNQFGRDKVNVYGFLKPRKTASVDGQD
jgi:DNA-binding beta-propeller fold protein YncE